MNHKESNNSSFLSPSSVEKGNLPRYSQPFPAQRQNPQQHQQSSPYKLNNASTPISTLQSPRYNYLSTNKRFQAPGQSHHQMSNEPQDQKKDFSHPTIRGYIPSGHEHVSTQMYATRNKSSNHSAPKDVPNNETDDGVYIEEIQGAHQAGNQVLSPAIDYLPRHKHLPRNEGDIRYDEFSIMVNEQDSLMYMQNRVNTLQSRKNALERQLRESREYLVQTENKLNNQLEQNKKLKSKLAEMEFQNLQIGQQLKLCQEEKELLIKQTKKVEEKEFQYKQDIDYFKNLNQQQLEKINRILSENQQEYRIVQQKLGNMENNEKLHNEKLLDTLKNFETMIVQLEKRISDQQYLSQFISPANTIDRVKQTLLQTNDANCGSKCRCLPPSSYK